MVAADREIFDTSNIKSLVEYQPELGPAVIISFGKAERDDGRDVTVCGTAGCIQRTAPCPTPASVQYLRRERFRL
jgi:hypothetical protein